MRLYFKVILLFLFGLGCRGLESNHSEILEGDLYFSHFRTASFYNQPDSIIKEVIAIADTTDRSLLDSTELPWLKMYDLLKKEDLLYSPYISIKLNTDSIVTILLSREDYLKIAPTDYQYLIRTGKKIRIKAEVRNIGGFVSYCSKLILLDTLNGETLPKSNKWKIDEYR